ncbi:hypothetical protein ACQ4M4_18845 [Leptolyngbya sp. AN02str]|uniref:hypothetical protein n=1 Tax=Leptolyngbya sp. AN02str TaxID=3423363 RepID=UPI003D31987E
MANERSNYNNMPKENYETSSGVERDDVQRDNYDRGIIPAETAARMEREGEEYKHTAKGEAKGENKLDQSDLDTTAGYTVDNEGLVNNFAIEPEMYYETPGDMQEKEAAEDEARREELAAINDNDETGKLTETEDKRSKGPGLI